MEKIEYDGLPAEQAINGRRECGGNDEVVFLRSWCRLGRKKILHMQEP